MRIVALIIMILLSACAVNDFCPAIYPDGVCLYETGSTPLDQLKNLEKELMALDGLTDEQKQKLEIIRENIKILETR